MPNLITKIADQVIGRSIEPSPHVLIGPVRWQLKENSDTRQWYFIIASGDRGGFFCEQISFKNDRDFADECRAALRFELLQRNPIVVHDFDDELEMARWAESIWPGKKTRDIRAGIEAERRQSPGDFS